MLSLLVITHPFQMELANRFWNSIKETTKKWELLDIVVKVDDDDPEMLAFWKDKPRTHIVVMPGKWRRTGIAVYLNELCRRASGDFLFTASFWLISKTPGWETIFEEEYIAPRRDKIWSGQPYIPGCGAEYPSISRAWFETTGHFGFSYSTDSYVNTVGECLPGDRRIPITNVVFERDRPRVPNTPATHEISGDHWGSRRLIARIKADQRLILEAIEKGR